MNTTLKTGIVLFLICAVCATLCAWVNSFTAPMIAENVAAANRAALESVSAGLEIGDTSSVDGNDTVVEETPLYSSGKLSGYVLQLKGKGYGGEFTIIASYGVKGELIKAQMTEDSETAGLGKNAENEWYMNLFTGMGDTVSFPSGKNDLNESDKALISGASFTFRAVSATLRSGSEYVKEKTV